MSKFTIDNIREINAASVIAGRQYLMQRQVPDIFATSREEKQPCRKPLLVPVYRKPSPSSWQVAAFQAGGDSEGKTLWAR